MKQKLCKRILDSEIESRLFVKELRESIGLECNNCGCQTFNWVQKRWRWHCKRCSNTKTLKGGTIMKNSNLPVRLWLNAIHIFTHENGEISASSLQSKLSLTRYEPAWYMLHKLRSAIVTIVSKSEFSNFTIESIYSNILDVKKVKVPKHSSGCNCSWTEDSKATACVAELEISMMNHKMKLIALNEPKYNVLDELSPCEIDHPRRRYALKKISSKNEVIKSEHWNADYIMQNFRSTFLKGLISKLRMVHRGVTMRYVQQYIQEYNFFRGFPDDLKANDLFLRQAMVPLW